MSELFGYECPLCKRLLVEQELRQAPYMENLVNIYRCLDASFSSHMIKSGNMAKGNVGSSTLENFDTRCSNLPPMDAQRAPLLDNSTATVQVGHDFGMRNGSMEQGFQTLESNMSSGKGVEGDGCDARSSDNTIKTCSVKKSAKRKVDDLKAEELDDMNPRPGSSSGDQIAVESDSTSLVNFICAFCQTWKITEGSGPMQHFANKKEVFGSEAGHSNVIHVHKSCFEWAPLIFFESDTVIKNLDKEIARAAKLKCSSCGLKGAALGCYAKSCRRSYHVPCAYDIVECRWDTDDYLMLCPSHTSHKFPREKPRKPVVKKCTSSTQTDDEHGTSLESDFWATSLAGTRRLVLCGSALSADEKFLLVEFATMCGATVTKAWNPNVTHVIAATDGSGACSRTLKFLMAILKGIWILKTDWIKACMQSKCPVYEEPYEIGVDSHGCCDGPKTGRLRALNNAPQLFNGLRFFFTGDLVLTNKAYIQDLIIAGGGTIIATRDELKECSGPHSSPSVLVVYNNDAMLGTLDPVLRQKVTHESWSKAITPTWVVDSIASGALQPFAQR